VPAGAPDDADRADALDIAAYHTAMDGTRGFLLHDALQHAMACVVRGNEYVQSMQPWALAKGTDDVSRRKLDNVLSSLVRQLARQTVLLAPFVPQKAQVLWTQLGAPGTVHDQRFDRIEKLDAKGWKVAKGEPLFPKQQAASAG
jgi:methionyl-tRNA synthetase